MLNNAEHIIAIRKQDISLAYQAFGELMQKTECLMNEQAKNKSDVYRNLSAIQVENISVETIKRACDNTPFHADEIKLISGQRFPDIVAEKYYGVEVKTTKANHWMSTGSSIVESTRDLNVEDIYMLFGKLGGDVPEFKCRPYEDVLYDIAVTHSPRYLINMEIDKNETIFSKIGVPYNEFRKSSDAIDKVRCYYREKARKTKRQEMPWWITSDNSESAVSFNIRLWNTLSLEEKRSLLAKCMILFPEALNPAKRPDKYNQTTLWLCSYQQVVMPNIRDLYSAGGRITHVDGKKLKKNVPQVFNQIIQHIDLIRDMLQNPTKEMMMLISDYNPILLKGNDLFSNWLDICCGFIQNEEVRLKEWIKSKPKFQFSKLS